MYDIISKKKQGVTLNEAEIQFVVQGFTAGEIPDYQMSAFLMAVYFKGMSEAETNAFTLAMAHSGDMVDLSPLKGIKVDKHSTGGVGDKTSLIIGPVVAHLGVTVAKMSGRGLGHTGGTIDKLEAIPGLQTSLAPEDFIRIVNENGLCIAGQSGNLAPADKKIYALRDVTATVDSIPLIAASIMSKKLAAGSDCILLDVKTGSGAFMKTTEESIALAQAMVNIGEGCGRKTVALITDMDVPLGHAIGNSLELMEVVDVLSGRGPKDLTDICIELAANMLFLAGKGDLETCKAMAETTIMEGRALYKLADMVQAQGGDRKYIEEPSLFPKAAHTVTVTAPKDGAIAHMDAEGCGRAAMVLGAGRETSASAIDYSAGIMLHKKTGDQVKAGDVLATLYTNAPDKLQQAAEGLLGCFTFTEQPIEAKPLVLARVSRDGVTYPQA